jgi:hypothetical protein
MLGTLDGRAEPGQGVHICEPVLLIDGRLYAPYSRAGITINGSNRNINGAIRRGALYDPPAGYEVSPYSISEKSHINRVDVGLFLRSRSRCRGGIEGPRTPPLLTAGGRA